MAVLVCPRTQATNAWFFEDPQYQLADANCAVQQYLEEEEEKEADQARRARAQGKGEWA